jgi:hypothetical protein
VRLVIVAVAALISWGQTGPLSAAEAVRLPVSCSYVANKVVLAPSPSDELHVIVGDREHKSIRACAPGLGGKCRVWEVYRFDLMCGGRQVSWRLVAAQLQSLPAAAVRRDAPIRSHLEPWEARILLSETDFAPVDEFGGRILPVANKPGPPSGGRDGVVARAALTREITSTDVATPPPGSLRPDTDAVSPKTEPQKSEPPRIDPPKAAEEIPAVMPVSLQPPPAERADARPGSAAGAPPSDGLKRDAASAPGAAGSDMADAAEAAAPDKSPQPRNGQVSGQPGSQVGFPLPALAAAVVLILIALVVAGVLMRRRPAPPRPYRGIVRVVYETEPYQEPDIDAAAQSRELMKQVSVELVNAMSAVNGLKGAPALQTALHTELDSIRRSLGFTQQSRGKSGEKKDWNQIKTQLTLSLEGTQRIIGIAEAARTSFSAHPAALEVITTRLEAYAFLGVNASASETALKKAVNALRQCWHPDLATDEEDRRLREIRIKQINMAWDLISRKQMSAC